MIERMKIQERNRNMVHGGDIYRNCISLDYSVNINPLGIPASVEAALREAVSFMQPVSGYQAGEAEGSHC